MTERALKQAFTIELETLISYPLQKSTYLVLAIFNRIVFSLELFQTYQNWQVRHLYPLRCGCYPYLPTYVRTYLPPRLAFKS